ncbi:MAG: sulfatase-like hydrolase/transferase [Chlorobi bacterium]|nr:sulfatase-like hydrolase/transferase [Chlorobiota bacterium]
MIESKGIFLFKLHTVIPAYTLVDNGRMASFILYSRHLQYKQEQMKEKRPNFTWNEILDTLYPLQSTGKSNVYVILLESFIDVRDLHGVTFNKNPIYHKFLHFLPGDTFYYAKSSYIGWGTAQTTFEVFTGIPALHKYSDVEFAMFNAYPVPSLLQWLKQNDYSTVAFVATGKDYYNMANAYKSLGFDSTIFLKELPEYRDLLRVMDSSLYNFGLDFIRNNVRKPFIVYFVTMYEHWPWQMNPPAGKEEISVNPNIPEIEFLANATYWRTRDLYNFISHILTMDSSAIIVFYGDHTPPQVNWDGIAYRKQPDAAPFLIINKGRVVTISTKKHAIPFYIINRIIHKCLVTQQCTEIYADSLYLDSNIYVKIYDDIIKYGFSGM